MTTEHLDPRLFLKMIWALQAAHDALTDPYLGPNARCPLCGKQG